MIGHVLGTTAKSAAQWHCVHWLFWRRKRDSNPRASYPANGFQDRRFQPLTHSSKSNLADSLGIAQSDGYCAKYSGLPSDGCWRRSASGATVTTWVTLDSPINSLLWLLPVSLLAGAKRK